MFKITLLEKKNKEVIYSIIFEVVRILFKL